LLVQGEDCGPDSEAVPIATDVNTAVTGDEADEAARRRKTAERMAKLGGAKMGFGLPGPGLPPKALSTPNNLLKVQSKLPMNHQWKNSQQ
ncbi:hypothetical protein Pst134EA_031800, partial [Puccinia striiformis f. sp. tritici]|uniref:uncharacterized protein n=1 Tax=Puccinia striiformis f. sp. tritici TaxID=168172 RepID=UPI0020089BA0